MEVLHRNSSEKLVFLETFGCQMNENDSERMLGFLKDIRYSRTATPENADLIIINTCSIRDKAEQKVYSILGRFKELKKENPGLIIGVSGCVAQQEGATLLKRAPHLDIVFGPHNVHKVKYLLSEAEKKKRVVAVEFKEGIDEDEYACERPETGRKAFVSIMRGCDNFCSYCIVPYTRGREVSRRSADIVAEVVSLSGAGAREVTLIGQNVNSYGTGAGGDVGFPELLRKVASVDGIQRVRFITSHPKDISEDLIRLFGAEPKLCRHIHLPVQSGSVRILKEMRRGYTVSEYLSKILLLRQLYPEMAITTDIIVGFPGETDSDFNDTIELVNTVRFDNIFSFMYSPRPGTKAAAFDGQVEPETRAERLRVLQERQKEITAERNMELVGRTMEVLVEGVSKVDPEEISGRTTCNRIVNFRAPLEMNGTLVDVLITRAYANSLRGEQRERSVSCY
ncbi:MAG: tRNA (N6-isopentenyl adenosine(37)-C2)-methylthiotransferase MiaB [Deltaproteobacteria bacterium]|nr:tRNA (N6-isopentenyl adenosine(37)-C2)-methylthiotransferase MiaB [Deltaproteobacteria bacterium]